MSWFFSDPVALDKTRILLYWSTICFRYKILIYWSCVILILVLHSVILKHTSNKKSFSFVFVDLGHVRFCIWLHNLDAKSQYIILMLHLNVFYDFCGKTILTEKLVSAVLAENMLFQFLWENLIFGFCRKMILQIWWENIVVF